MNDMMQASDMDALYLRAAALVVKEGKANTSFVQRRLTIGYNKAARLIERLEENGIVSASDHVGKRHVAAVADLRAALGVTRDLPDDAGNAEIAEAILGALDDASGQVLGVAHQEARVRSGQPPMKLDPDFEAAATHTYRATASELRRYVEEVERLDAEKKDIADQQKEVMAEAKGRGYDTKILRRIIALRKRDPNSIAEEDVVLRLYKDALGML